MGKFIQHIASLGVGDLAKNVEAFKNGESQYDPSKPFAVYKQGKVEHVFTDLMEAIRHIEEYEGYMTFGIPTTDGKVFQIAVHNQKTDEFIKTHQRNDVLETLIDGKGGGLGSLLGIMMASRLTDIMKETKKEVEDHEAIVKPFRDALKEGDTVKFMPTNYRRDVCVTELTVPQYHRLKDLGMIDDCPVCTKREQRLVVHEEDAHTYEGIVEFINKDLPNVAV